MLYDLLVVLSNVSFGIGLLKHKRITSAACSQLPSYPRTMLLKA